LNRATSEADMSRISFLEEHDIPHGPGDIVFRQRRLGNAIAALLSTTAAAAGLFAPSLGPHFGWEIGPAVYFSYFFGALLTLFAAFAITALKRSLAPTNWLLRLAANGIYLRYRSYLNGDYPGEAVAAFIPVSAIGRIRPAIEKSTRIGSKGSKYNATNRRLEIIVRDADLAPFKSQIERERTRRIATKLGSKGVFRHYPVRIRNADTIEIDWRDTQSSVKPGLKAAVAILGRRFATLPETKTARTDPDHAGRQEQEAQIIALVERGETIQAIKLTKRLYGLSTTEARIFVDELAS
jgi:hypothetical protein